MGRTKERKKDYRILSCEVPKSLSERLIEETKAAGRSKSEIIRTALRDYLDTAK